MDEFVPPRLYVEPEFFEIGISVGPLKGCTLCGALVTEETRPQHRRWHRELAADVLLAAKNQFRTLTTS